MRPPRHRVFFLPTGRLNSRYRESDHHPAYPKDRHIRPLGSDKEVHANRFMGDDALCVRGGFRQRPTKMHVTRDECCVTCTDCRELIHA